MRKSKVLGLPPSGQKPYPNVFFGPTPEGQEEAVIQTPNVLGLPPNGFPEPVNPFFGPTREGCEAALRLSRAKKKGAVSSTLSGLVHTLPDGTHFVFRGNVDDALHEICHYARQGLPVAIERGTPGKMVYDLIIVASPSGVDPFPSIDACCAEASELRARALQRARGRRSRKMDSRHG